MKLFGQLIGGTTFALVGIVFVLADLLTRIVVVPLVWIRPASRARVLSGWAQGICRLLVGVLHHVGQARFDIRPAIPARGGVLVVMNHQSILDIPVAFRCVPRGYPRMVVHFRYGKGVPLVSYMIRFMDHIPVFPGRTGRTELEELARTARESALPIVIFPEGHRTRDGEIRQWKRAGLDAFLSAREWTVYVVVLDGMWRVARIPDFVRNLTSVRCRVEEVGPFEYDGRGRESHDEFVETLRRAMCDKLAAMRNESPENARRTARGKPADAVSAT